MSAQRSIEGQVIGVRVDHGRRVATLASDYDDATSTIDVIIPERCPDVRGWRVRADRCHHLGGQTTRTSVITSEGREIIAAPPPQIRVPESPLLKRR